MFEIKSDLTHFMPLIFFDTPEKNLWFSDVSRGYQKEISDMKWVKTIGKLWENGLHVKISAELLHKLLTRYFSTN